MALEIVENLCTACAACEPVCPNEAISLVKRKYVIEPEKCTECEGEFDVPQCLDVCPIEDCIVPA